MLRWQAGVAFALAAVSAAVAQSQRVYVFPQRTSVTADRAGLLVGMCLDPYVIGAPGCADPVTQFARPEAIVVRRWQNGQVVDTRRWSEFTADDPPWVAFYGAADVTGHVSLQAVATPPLNGVAYEVEFVDGTAAARPQEALTGRFLARLDEYSDSFGVFNAELAELRAAFGEDAVLTRVFGQFARQTLYPAMSRDARPRDLARAVSTFLERVDGVLSSTAPQASTLLAVAVGADAEPTAAQRTLLRRHGLPAATGGVESVDLAAAAQFHAVFGDSLVLASAADGAGLALAQRAAHRLAHWRASGLSYSDRQAAYAAAPVFKVTGRGGRFTLSRAPAIDPFDLGYLLKRFRAITRARLEEPRRTRVDRALAELDEALARQPTRRGLPANFAERPLADQTRALLLLGEDLRGTTLAPALRTLLHGGPALTPGLRAALYEEHWLIDAAGLSPRRQAALERQLAELTELSGIRCTLLCAESDRAALLGPEVRARL